jgi:7-carboxy-7-deazaguanine synthase
MINIQPAEKMVRGDGEHLDVHSIFHTIQGEGPFAGRPAVFVRLAGCSIQCPRCDTDYTSTRKTWETYLLASEVTRLRNKCTNLVVITGGEPLRQPIALFIQILLKRGYRVQIETNGVHAADLPSETIIVCSPKTGTINHLLVPYLNALKYVISADDLGEDGYPNHALSHGTSLLARPPKGFSGTIYMQPQDDQDPIKNQANLEAAVRACYQTGNTLCLQLHKIIGAE